MLARKLMTINHQLRQNRRRAKSRRPLAVDDSEGGRGPALRVRGGTTLCIIGRCQECHHHLDAGRRGLTGLTLDDLDAGLGVVSLVFGPNPFHLVRSGLDRRSVCVVEGGGCPPPFLLDQSGWSDPPTYL